MRLLSVVGARPQFVKLAPVGAAARQAGHEHLVLHTGQHYDANMSDAFFDDLEIPEPDINLEIGSGRHGAQTAAMLEGIETYLIEREPDCVVVYGDTNSTIAAAIAAVKLHIPIAHVEAGLRSKNRKMPEEHNRVVTDHCSDLLLAPTQTAMQHLSAEGLSERSRLVGDVMFDVFTLVRESISPNDDYAATSGEYALATIHRQENTDDRQRLSEILEALAVMPIPVILPAHPRLVAKTNEYGVNLETGAIKLVTPLGYPDLVSCLVNARSVITDSGGLQKEAFFAGVPCTTVRTETEWVETLEDNWNVLVSNLGNLSDLALRSKPEVAQRPLYGLGDAGVKSIQAIESLL